MYGFEHVTIDHQQIRHWAKEHDLAPALIEPDVPHEKKGLRFDAPGSADERMLSESRDSHDVSWDEFFAEFEEQQLALAYNNEFEDSTAGYKFLHREGVTT